MSLYNPGQKSGDIVVDDPSPVYKSSLRLPVHSTSLTILSDRAGVPEQTLRDAITAHQWALQVDGRRCSVLTGLVKDPRTTLLAVDDSAGFIVTPESYWEREYNWLDVDSDILDLLPEAYLSTAVACFEQVSRLDITSAIPDGEPIVYGVSTPFPAASIYEAGVERVMTVQEFGEMIAEAFEWVSVEGAILYAIQSEYTVDDAYRVGSEVYSFSRSDVDEVVRKVDAQITGIQEASPRKIGEKTAVQLGLTKLGDL